MKPIIVDFKRYKEEILKKPYGINIIFGQKGAGKTSLNTVFGVWEMAIKERFQNCLSAISNLSIEKNREYTLPPQNHCVYSSPGYSISNNWKYGKGELTSYTYNPYYFNLPNERIDYEIYPEFSSFHLMEAQASLNSRDSKNFPDETSRAYENERHPSYLITMDCQRLGLIDVNVRKITDNFICPIGLEHETNSMETMVKTIFHTICFKVMSQAEAFEEKNITEGGVLVDFVFEGGCIFNCYDSQGSKHLYFDTDKDFQYILSNDPNNKISLLPPKNYKKRS